MGKMAAIVILALIGSAQAALAAKVTLNCEEFPRSTNDIAYDFTCDEAMIRLDNQTWSTAQNVCLGLGFDGACSDGTGGSCYWNGSTGSFQANGFRHFRCGYIVDP